MNRLNTIVSSLVLAVCVVGAIAYFSGGTQGRSAGTAQAGTCDKGSDRCRPALDLIDENGDVWNQASLKDKVVVINFWAHWCKPCIKEIPDLSKFYQEHKDTVVILGIQQNWKGTAHLQAFSKTHNLTYPVVVSNDTILDAFRWPQRLPTTFIYDRAGNLVKEHEGPLSHAQLSSVIEPLL